MKKLDFDLKSDGIVKVTLGANSEFLTIPEIERAVKSWNNKIKHYKSQIKRSESMAFKRFTGGVST